MTTTLPTGLPAHERLPLSTKLAFGAGDLGPAIATILVSFFQLFFLTTVAGLAPAAAGSILLVVKVWDAVNDPIMGWLTDRTTTRFGRRRPWLLIGALPFGLLLFAQWVAPPFSDSGKYVYYLVVALLFDTAFTMVNVPYTALTPELTRDYHERTSLNSYRFAFSIGGSLVAGALHQVIVGQFCADPTACTTAESRVGYLVAGAIWGALVVLPFIWCFLGTKERYEAPADEAEMGLVDQVRTVFANRPYRIVIGLYLFSWLAVQMTAATLTFYVTFWLQRADLIPIVLLAVQGTAFVFLFVWSAVSRRIGKRAVYYIGSVFWIAVQTTLFFVQPGQIPLTLGLAALAGVGVAVAYLIPWSMLPDVIELDELQTGRRREGMFYGFMVFLQKLGLAVGLFLVGLALQWQGFDEAASVGQQPASALLAIRFMVGPAPTVSLILGMLLATRYPITKESHEATLAALRERGEEVRQNEQNGQNERDRERGI